MTSYNNDLKQPTLSLLSPVRYKACYYAPASFVLFLIAFTFPVHADFETSALFNLWIHLFFRVLPIDVPFQRYLKSLGFDPLLKPMLKREEFVTFAIGMHRLVLGETLDRGRLMAFFEALRANDCHSAPVPGTQTTQLPAESGCRRTGLTVPSTCLVITERATFPKSPVLLLPQQQSERFVSDVTTTVPECFVLDATLQTAALRSQSGVTVEEAWERAMRNGNAFCSCLFSAKWFVLHMVATGYMANEIRNYHGWLTLFGKVLACSACKNNFTSNMKIVQYSPQEHLKDEETFFAFTCKLHDTVSKMLHKPIPQHAFTIKDARDFYHTLEHKTTSEHLCVVSIVRNTQSTTTRFLFQP